ncbi:GATA zinc finger domain-containing protein 4-like [Gordionus sp. m RMFG-2023]|uniref:GATA zinc finger domain-containing protein 4-like n=1 Tax=Gordionus sp. m RMFG-2023 TaxID=3053472 RepID=UPI0031FE10EA
MRLKYDGNNRLACTSNDNGFRQQWTPRCDNWQRFQGNNYDSRYRNNFNPRYQNNFNHRYQYNDRAPRSRFNNDNYNDRRNYDRYNDRNNNDSRYRPRYNQNYDQSYNRNYKQNCNQNYNQSYNNNRYRNNDNNQRRYSNKVNTVNIEEIKEIKDVNCDKIEKEEYSLFNVDINNLDDDNNKAYDAYKITMHLNDVPIELQIDTGSRFTILPISVARKIGIKTLKKSETKLTGYDGRIIKVLGTIDIKAKYGNKTEILNIHVGRAIKYRC